MPATQRAETSTASSVVACCVLRAGEENLQLIGALESNRRGVFGANDRVCGPVFPRGLVALNCPTSPFFQMRRLVGLLTGVQKWKWTTLGRAGAWVGGDRMACVN